MSDFITIGKKHPWRHRAGEPPTYDLSRGGDRISIKTDDSEVWIDPSKTALVIIDMLNFFLCPALGHDPSGPGSAAMTKLVELVPAVREAGVQVIWCGWGLTQEDIDEMPTALIKGFLNDDKRNTHGDALKPAPTAAVFLGFGSEMGRVNVDGKEVDAGRLAMRDQWNTSLPAQLEAVHDRTRDIWAPKNRMSGLWSSDTPLHKVLQEKGMRTLLFAGVNTDQCVQDTLIDAVHRGWDAVLVKDATGTTTPHGQEVTESNTSGWGFMASSEELRKGVAAGKTPA